MFTERNTISKAFYITFGTALVLESTSLALSYFELYAATDSPVAVFWFWARYAPVIAFGFMIGRVEQPYRTALINACVFALLWFMFGYFTLAYGIAPGSVTADEHRLAQWGYLIASLLFLPLALLMAALGVWLARTLDRLKRTANAA